jgi:DNA-binding NarL/FixJ family response regulator
VVAEAANGKEAILKAIETKPDIAVVDYALPLVNGVEVTRQIRARLPKTEVLSSPCMTTRLIHELLKAGARGYVLKTEARSPLISSEIGQRVAELRPARVIARLTTRDHACCTLTTSGGNRHRRLPAAGT